MFYSYFYEGDHVACHFGFPNDTIIKPQFQGQMDRLFMNHELGLPTVLPNGKTLGEAPAEEVQYRGGPENFRLENFLLDHFFVKVVY